MGGFVEYYSAFKAYSDINSDEYRKRIENLEPLLMKFMKTRGRVLDLACGVGGFSFLLEDLGFNVVGLDNSKFMLEKAREFAKEKESRVEFIEGDARELPFENNSFDYVLFIDSLVHFEPPGLGQGFQRNCESAEARREVHTSVHRPKSAPASSRERSSCRR